MKKTLLAGAALGLLLSAFPAMAQKPRPIRHCDDNGALCTEVVDSIGYGGAYTGHDEPSILFYSNSAGSGNSNRYFIQLPKDPPKLPKQDGTGGTFNFQLHPAFWFGMALCDSQSAPVPGLPCAADTDANIFDGADPAAADYIGNHPGTAFMEMQFYAPGWAPWPAGDSCDPTRWCAALNIDSLSENMNTGQVLNATCASQVGLEYVNFAFITKSGVPIAPPSPVNATLATFTPNPTKLLFMNSGDWLQVDLFDTASGLKVVIRDLTSGQRGSMVASASNGFGQVQFAPTGTACNNIPYDFHPMYSTSSEHTRVPWAAHSYNVAFSDEIGHFEYCDSVDANGNCTQAGVNDSALDGDDGFCFGPADSTRVRIGGCLATDVDFDGVPYKLVWPGTNANLQQDRLFHAQPIRFTSPKFASGGAFDNAYERVAFEADLPRIEVFGAPNNCNRSTGANCVNPPKGADFYPFFSTAGSENACNWQLGGDFIPGTTNDFGGSSTTEFGPLLQLVYPGVGGTPIFRYNNFRQVLSGNPCQSDR